MSGVVLSPSVFSSSEHFRNYMQQSPLQVSDHHPLLIEDVGHFNVFSPEAPFRPYNLACHYLSQILWLSGLGAQFNLIKPGETSISFLGESFYFSFSGRVQILARKLPLYINISVLFEDMIRSGRTTLELQPDQELVILGVDEEAFKEVNRGEITLSDIFRKQMDGLVPALFSTSISQHNLLRGRIRYFRDLFTGIVLKAGEGFTFTLRIKDNSMGSITQFQQSLLQYGSIRLPPNTPFYFRAPEFIAIRDNYNQYFDGHLPWGPFFFSQLVATLGQSLHITGSIRGASYELSAEGDAIVLKSQAALSLCLEEGPLIFDFQQIGDKMLNENRMTIHLPSLQQIVFHHLPNSEHIPENSSDGDQLRHQFNAALAMAAPIGFEFIIYHSGCMCNVSKQDGRASLHLTFPMGGSLQLIPASYNRFAFAIFSQCVPDHLKGLFLGNDSLADHFFVIKALYHYLVNRSSYCRGIDYPSYFSTRTQEAIENFINNGTHKDFFTKLKSQLHVVLFETYLGFFTQDFAAFPEQLQSVIITLSQLAKEEIEEGQFLSHSRALLSELVEPKGAAFFQ